MLSSSKVLIFSFILSLMVLAPRLPPITKIVLSDGFRTKCSKAKSLLPSRSIISFLTGLPVITILLSSKIGSSHHKQHNFLLFFGK